MENNYVLPLFYKIDIDIINTLKEKLSEIKPKKIIFLTDRIVYELYGKNFEKIIEDFIFMELLYIEDNSISFALDLSEKIIENEIEIIIGLGGGKVLDVAKYSAYTSKIPFISIPTTVANDGIASPISVLKDKEGFTRSLGAKVPTGILIDLNIIKNSSVKFLKAGIGDILSNYTALFDWKISKEKVNDFSYLVSKVAFNSIFYFDNKNLESEEFIKKVCESIILSGISMEIAGTSRPCSGSEHLFSHYIDKYYEKKNLHGFQVALGAVTTCFFQNRDYKMLIEFLKNLEIRINPSSLNITKNEFVKIWKNCKKMRKNRVTVLDYIEIKENEILNIYDILEEEFKK